MFAAADKPCLLSFQHFKFGRLGLGFGLRGAFEAFVKADVEMKVKTVWGSNWRFVAHRWIILVCWILSMLVYSTNTSAHEVMHSRYVFL